MTKSLLFYDLLNIPHGELNPNNEAMFYRSSRILHFEEAFVINETNNINQFIPKQPFFKLLDCCILYKLQTEDRFVYKYVYTKIHY